MALLTEAQAFAALRRRGVATKSGAEAELRRSASTDKSTLYDVFLSHSHLDAARIAAVKAVLEEYGLKVYVDWLEDPEADRTQVTAKTAEMLRDRMRHSNCLIFATSKTSSSSKWMPWELGFFDGLRPDKVAILPLAQDEVDDSAGQEYLGLYPYIEELPFTTGGSLLGIRKSATEGQHLEVFASNG
jgi:hypothetical protein